MKVSILIPCFNAAQWVGQAIQSAIDQSYSDKEIIVYDDGSSDGSLDVIREYDQSIRWEAGDHVGGNAARNWLLAQASGDWIQYLDADDYLLPQKVKQQVEFINHVPGVDVVYSPVIMEYHSDHATSREILEIPKPHDEWVLLARWYLPQTGAPLWRKQTLVDCGGWKVDQPACQEHELYLRMLIRGKEFEYFPQAGAVYRQWSEETVCKRDPAVVRKLRFEIEQRAEHFLEQTGRITPVRRWSINMARFELARKAWQTDREEALEYMNEIHNSEPEFVPKGSAAPELYQLVYRTLGFRAAEIIAGLRREALTKKGRLFKRPNFP